MHVVSTWFVSQVQGPRPREARGVGEKGGSIPLEGFSPKL